MVWKFKGHTHKITCFKRYGREEQKGKRKKIKKTKIVEITKKRPFFFWGGWGGDRCHQVYVLMCTIDALATESYAAGLFYLQELFKMP